MPNVTGKIRIVSKPLARSVSTVFAPHAVTAVSILINQAKGWGDAAFIHASPQRVP